MMRGRTLQTLAFTALATPALCGDWNRQLAAEYLDSRQKQWFEWKPAIAAAGGPCVSCHTGTTYLLARPALRQVLGERERTSYETGMLDGLRTRLAKDSKTMFPSLVKEPLASQAAGVEAVIAAFALAPEWKGGANDAAQQAFDRMWSLQLREGAERGAWRWFNLDLDPWETPNSVYFGAATAAIATGSTPAVYRDRPEVRERIADLTEYLQREQPNQPLHNRLILLWASSKLPAAMPEPARKQTIEEIWRVQEKDGGWTIESFGPWKKRETAPPASGSNGYATALATFTLQKAGITSSDPRLRRAVDWLKSNQNPQSGSWTADSMNKTYPPDSMQINFMRDAATSFAVLALLEAER